MTAHAPGPGADRTDAPPVLSILLPAGSDPDEVLSSVGSAALVRADDATWELVVAGTADALRPARAFEQPWLRWVETGPGSRAALLRAALAVARGGHVAVVGPGDRLDAGGPTALENHLRARPEVDVAYTDELRDDTGRTPVVRKPAWNLAYLRGWDYLGRLCAVRRTLLDEVGGFVDDRDGAEEWDLHLRCAERSPRVDHLPVVGLLRPGPVRVPDERERAARRAAVAAHLERTGARATVEDGPVPGSVVVHRHVPDPAPLVSVVVPTASRSRRVHDRDVLLVEQCVRTLLERTAYPSWELVLVANGDEDPTVVDRVAALAGERARVVRPTGPFNFSRSVNEGVRVARGEIVLLLNDDVEALDDGWLTRMVSVLQEPGVGVVGAKLLFEDGTVQHVGVVNGDDWLPVHARRGEPDDLSDGDVGVLDADFLVVTGACLLVARDTFVEVGGFCEDLPLSFNDVDFCYKVVTSGQRVVCTPLARLSHYESSSRSTAVTAADLEMVREQWDLMALADPYRNLRTVR